MVSDNKKRIVVMADIDFGKFTNNFNVETTDGNSIQEEYDLTMEDFNSLDIMIADTIGRFLDMKENEGKRKLNGINC